MKAFPIHQRELKIIDVEVLSAKDREPGEAPGVKLVLMGDFPPSQLDHLVAGLSTQLWQKGTQAGVDADTDLTDRTELAKFLGEITPADKLTGYTGSVDFGTGKSSSIPVEGAMLHTFKISPKEGGGAKIKFSVDIPNCVEKVLGKLAIHKSQMADITLVPPAIQPEKKPDPAQIGLIGASTPPATKPPAAKAKPVSPFDHGDFDDKADDGIDSPAKALERAAAAQRH